MDRAMSGAEQHIRRSTSVVVDGECGVIQCLRATRRRIGTTWSGRDPEDQHGRL